MPPPKLGYHSGGQCKDRLGANVNISMVPILPSRVVSRNRRRILPTKGAVSSVDVQFFSFVNCSPYPGAAELLLLPPPVDVVDDARGGLREIPDGIGPHPRRSLGGADIPGDFIRGGNSNGRGDQPRWGADAPTRQWRRRPEAQKKG